MNPKAGLSPPWFTEEDRDRLRHLFQVTQRVRGTAGLRLGVGFGFLL